MPNIRAISCKVSLRLNLMGQHATLCVGVALKEACRTSAANSLRAVACLQHREPPLWRYLVASRRSASVSAQENPKPMSTLSQRLRDG